MVKTNRKVPNFPTNLVTTLAVVTKELSSTREMTRPYSMSSLSIRGFKIYMLLFVGRCFFNFVVLRQGGRNCARITASKVICSTTGPSYTYRFCVGV